jgi:hypothetical protein
LELVKGLKIVRQEKMMTGVNITLFHLTIGEKHKKQCGGNFIKISEPEGYIYKEKKKKSIEEEKN